MASQAAVDFITGRVRDLPDHPTPGVIFRDIMPLLADPVGLQVCVDAVTAPFEGAGVDMVVGVEARGFILAAPAALAVGAGFVAARKPGKLPGEVVSQSYELEYGADTLEIQAGLLARGAKVVVLDDVLATGGTAEAASALVRRAGGEVVGVSVLIELPALGGRSRLGGIPTHSVVAYR